MIKITQKNRIRNSILAVIIALLVIASIIYIGPHNNMIGDYVNTSYAEEFQLPSFITYELDEQHPFTQSFRPQYGYLTNIDAVMLQVGKEYTGTLHAVIKDEQGTVLTEKKKDIADMKNGDWSGFDINEKVKPGSLYSMELSVTDASAAPQLMIVNSAFDAEENEGCAYAGVPIAGGMILSYGYKNTYSVMFRTFVSVLLILAGVLAVFGLMVEEPFANLKKLIFEAEQIDSNNVPIKNTDIRKTAFYLLLGLFTLLILFLHTFRLSQIPYGVHIDEMGTGYDAYCIANWGVDRFQMSFPVYFINIGTGQNALYAYLAAICFKIFGYSEKVLRYPAVLNAALTVIFGAKLVYKKWHTRKSVLLFTAIYTILPICIMTTRFGLESYLMLGFSALFLYTFVTAIESGRKYQYVISGICGGILLYSYAISYLVMVAFLIISLVYVIRLRKLLWKQFISFAVPFAVIAMPLVLCQIINMFDLPEIRIGLLTITKLQGYRGSEIEFTHIVDNLLTTLKSVFWHDDVPYNSFTEYMTMYWVSIPVILIGVCHGWMTMLESWKKKEWNVSAMMMFWFLIMLLMGSLLGGDGPNCNKVNGIYIACLYFLIEGIICFAGSFSREKWCKGVLAVEALSYVVCFLTFSEYYFYHYTKEVYPEALFETTYGDALQILKNTGDTISNRTTYIEESSAIYFCGSTLISPYEFDYTQDTKQFRNYVFTYSTQIEEDANYILRDTNKTYAMELEKSGFLVQKAGSWFVCYMP